MTKDTYSTSMEKSTSSHGNFNATTAATSQIDVQLNPYFLHHSLGSTFAIVAQLLIGVVKLLIWESCHVDGYMKTK